MELLLIYAKIIDEDELKNTPDEDRIISMGEKPFMYDVLLKRSIITLLNFVQKYKKDESFRTCGTTFIYNCALDVINMLCEEC